MSINELLQQNIVRENGRRAVLLSVIKNDDRDGRGVAA